MLQTSRVWPFVKCVYADSEFCPIKFGRISPNFLHYLPVTAFCDVAPYKCTEISEEPAATIFRVE